MKHTIKYKEQNIIKTSVYFFSAIKDLKSQNRTKTYNYAIQHSMLVHISSKIILLWIQIIRSLIDSYAFQNNTLCINLYLICESVFPKNDSKLIFSKIEKDALINKFAMTFTFNFYSRDMVLSVSYLVLQNETIFQIFINTLLLLLFYEIVCNC